MFMYTINYIVTFEVLKFFFSFFLLQIWGLNFIDGCKIEIDYELFFFFRINRSIDNIHYVIEQKKWGEQ
jgi:hypothetical protein